MGGTVVLVTVVAAPKAREGQDFFPLTVDYVGEVLLGRPHSRRLLQARRPPDREGNADLAPDRSPGASAVPGRVQERSAGHRDRCVSLNPEVDGDIPALIGASAALTLAGIPFKGPIGAARVGYANGKYILNPTKTELETSDLDLVVAGTSNAVLMVESEAKLLSAKKSCSARSMFGHREMQKAINAINELAVEAGTKPSNWAAPAAERRR